MNWFRRAIPLLAVALVLVFGDFALRSGPALASQHKAPRRPAAGQLITIHVPHPEQLELHFDELELDWTNDPGAKARAPGRSAVEIAGARLVEREAARAAVQLSGVISSADLANMAKALQAVNPGAEVHLVLYEPGLPKSKATRRLLTREVGFLLEQGVDPDSVLAGLPVRSMSAVPGVPGGYVAEAEDPIAALDLADALRQRTGVRSAYPLLKRSFERR